MAWRRANLILAAVLAAGGLEGCANLPSSGPTAHDIVQDQKRANPLGFQIVDVTAASTAQANRLAGRSGPSLSNLARSGPVDLVGPGDELQITVFEVGTTLFSGSAAASALSSSALSAPTAAGETFPPVRVEQDGSVALPYIGRLQVAGRSVEEVQAMVTAGLAGKSQTPQVIVSVRENIANTVVVMGDVKKPGRLTLTLAGDRLLDAIASAGGGAYPTQDLIVRFSRGGQNAEARLDSITAGDPNDLALLPQDRIEVLYRPRSFTVFGATKVAETPFQLPRVSLAEAVARAGGPADQQADPSAVFVFRYEPEDLEGAPAPGARPIAYRLDMMRPESYFLSQAFEMRPRDVIYIANARINQVSKLMQILNLFFSPAYTAKVVSQ